MRKLSAIMILIAALALAGCQNREVQIDASKYPVRGVDVSAHNGDIDFQKLAADSIKFVYIKATEGSDFSDPLFMRNYTEATKAGLKVGAYHFFRFDIPGHIQAYNFMNAVEGKSLQLPAAIDVEEWGNAVGVPPDVVSAELGSMVEVLKSSGRKVVIYTNKKGYDYFIRCRYDVLPLWLCSLDAEPPSNVYWKFWQYSHRGRLPGVKGDVDLDVFNGTEAQFERWISPIDPF